MTRSSFLQDACFTKTLKEFLKTKCVSVFIYVVPEPKSCLFMKGRKVPKLKEKGDLHDPNMDDMRVSPALDS